MANWKLLAALAMSFVYSNIAGGSNDSNDSNVAGDLTVSKSR
jgi:hypothetical protein